MWFNHEKVGSFISFNVPLGVETDSLEMTLWVDYVNEGKHEVGLQAVIKNKTNDTEWTHEAVFFRTHEVNSWVSNGPQPHPIKCGDRIEVHVGGDNGLKVEKCGIHLAYNQHRKNLDFFDQKRDRDAAAETSCDSSNDNKLSKRLKIE